MIIIGKIHYFLYVIGKDLWKVGIFYDILVTLIWKYLSQSIFLFFLLIVDLKTGLKRNPPLFFIVIYKKEGFFTLFLFIFWKHFMNSKDNTFS